MRKILTAVLGIAAAIALVGCGGTSALGLSNNPRVRVVNAFYAPDRVNAKIDNQTVLTSATTGQSSQYTVFNNGNHDITFTDATTNGQLVVATNQLFELDTYYTIVGYGGPGSGSVIVLPDLRVVSGASAQVRVINAATNFQNVDVYITAPGDDISNMAPTSVSTLGSTESIYSQLQPNTYQIRIVESGTKNVLATQNLTVTSQQNYTIVVSPDGSSNSSAKTTVLLGRGL